MPLVSARSCGTGESRAGRPALAGALGARSRADGRAGRCVALRQAAAAAAARTRTNRSGTFPMAVARARFPRMQAIARPAKFELRRAQHRHEHGAERGGDGRLVRLHLQLSPNWPPTSARSGRSNGAPDRSPNPPVESQEVSPPGGGQTAYVNTWALGPLAPGQTRPVRAGTWCRSRPGTYTVHYAVAAGLVGQGQGRSRLAAGAIAGRITVAHRRARRRRRTSNPNTGQVDPGAAPTHP